MKCHWWYNHEISDHTMAKFSFKISQAHIRKKVLVKRDLLISDLTKLFEENDQCLSLTNIVEYIKDNKKYYVRKNLNPKVIMCEKGKNSLELNVKEIIRLRDLRFELTILSVITQRFSKWAKEAFEAVRSVTKYQLSKKEGSVATCIMIQNKIITEESMVADSIINYLRSADDKLVKELGECVPELPVDLDPLSENEIRILLNKLSQHKALSNTPVPDEVFGALGGRKEAKLDFINDLWKKAFWERHGDVADMKVMPLNKVSPSIPSPAEIRPICITNVLFKLAELRFNRMLNELYHSLPEFSRFQIGFVRGMSTQVNITRLMNQINQFMNLKTNQRWKNVYRNNLTFVIFIDYRGAYNLINRSKLFSKLNEEFPAWKKEFNFMNWLYSKQQAGLGSRSFKPRCGVPQGGINSPILFDFALYFIIEEFRNSVNKGILDASGLFLPGFLKTQNYQHSIITKDNSLAYVDDVAFIINFGKNQYYLYKYLQLFFLNLTEVSKKWGLTINFKKSGLLHVRPSHGTHLKTILSPYIDNEELKIEVSKEIYRLPVVRCYKYLGMTINERLDMSDHLKYLKQKINCLAYSFYAVRKVSLDVKFNQNIWQLIVRPLLEYAQNYVSYLSGREKKKLEVLYRTSLRLFIGFKKRVSNSIVDNLINVDYMGFSAQTRGFYERKWFAYSAGDLDHPIFEQRVPRIRNKMEFEGLEKEFVKSFNLLSSRLNCNICSDGSKINKNHYNKHFYSHQNGERLEEIIEETFKQRT